MRLFCYVFRMMDNLESKGIVTTDRLADVGVESNEGTTSASQFLSRSKGKDEVKRKKKQFSGGEPKSAVDNERLDWKAIGKGSKTEFMLFICDESYFASNYLRWGRFEIYLMHPSDGKTG
ncbi:hypothetical protein OIU79_026155 [Salix purpurea]|uniref:Uncharacterized protein n=1 Tax=Salix purpurea TaxID=77065 RepID=A0A9Q0VQS4_SALPP|nr:hypothetical protein OIU79_026155 [Salix purpurea]